MANLEVNYVEQGNTTNILNTINTTAQINTIHIYGAPSEYVDSSGGKWTIVPNTNRITVVARK